MVQFAVCVLRSTLAALDVPHHRSALSVQLVTVQPIIVFPVQVDTSPMDPFVALASPSVPTVFLALIQELVEHVPQGTMVMLANFAIVTTISQQAILSLVLPALK